MTVDWKNEPAKILLRCIPIERKIVKDLGEISDCHGNFLCTGCYEKKRNPDSKFYISNTNEAIVILQSSLCSSGFGLLLVDFSNEIDLKCHNRSFSKTCWKIIGWRE